MIHRLLAEEEMLNVHTVAIVLNCRKESDIYRQIFAEPSKVQRESLRKEEEKAESKDVDEEEDGAKRGSKKKGGGVSSAKENSIREVTDSKYPFKGKFLQRMKFAREWLDLGDVYAGMNSQLKVNNDKHESIIVEVIDVEKNTEEIEKLFNKIIT